MVRIVVADDQEIVRSGLRTILEGQLGWSVVAEAVDGKEAVSLALQSKPDVVIVDFVLPLLNGIEVTRQIRARLPQTEILMFTMRESDASIGEALHAGARAFIRKTESKTQIIAAVRALSNHRSFLAGVWAERLLDGFLEKLDKKGSVLSPRERLIVQNVAEGYSNREMGKLLNISIKTIETHRATALRKLHITTTAGLVRYAIRNQFVDA